MLKESDRPPSLGISPDWPSRRSVAKQLRKYTPFDVEAVRAYNLRLDVENKNNVVQARYYFGAGARRLNSAVASSLEGGKGWETEVAEAITYMMFGDKLLYFWHEQFQVLFPQQRANYRSLPWRLMTDCLAFALMLGWKEEAIYQGYLIFATLKKNYQLKLDFDTGHRRAHAFMLRLFANWQGGIHFTWPSWGVDTSIYNAILTRWRTRDAEELAPWIVAAADRHTYESKHDTENHSYDFGDYRETCTPIEILMVFRLRELFGLANPVIEHPLLDPPFNQLPSAKTSMIFDPLMEATMARVYEDWPNFNAVTDLETLKAVAIG